MKKTLLLLSSVAALTMAACSQEKTADTATTTPPAEATMPADGAMPSMDAGYRSRASRIADRMASDMKINDTATVGKIRNVYYNRARRYGDLRNQYAADTTGMNAAMRGVDTETDTQIQSTLTDPTQYQTYQGSRSNYAESNYMDDNGAMSADAPVNNDAAMSSNATSTTMEAGKMKIKGDDGSKIKVKGDGDIKIRDAQDNKAKIDADDGTIKLKPENGKKTVIK